MASDTSRTIELPPKMLPVLEAVQRTLKGGDDPIRYVALYGGRGSAKSHSVARVLVNIAAHVPGIRILCTREIQKSIEESVYQLLLDTIKDVGYSSYFTATKTSITGRNGSKFLFAGLRSQDIQKIRSTENVQLVWIEEGQMISQKSLDVLIPTIRAERSIIFITYNPELEDDPVHKNFVMTSRPDCISVKMNWRDNPWFPSVLETERVHLFNTDDSPGKVRYHNIWEGECLPAVEGAIFAREVAKLFEDGRVRPLDYDARGKVYGVMDLGWGVSTMILAQRFASTVQIIGYKEWTNRTYAEMSAELRQDYPSVRWGKIFMPHDASHRDPKYGKSHFDVMEEQGWQTAKIPQIGVENYIEAGRNLFGRVYISDKAECERLTHCLRRWRYQVSETTDRVMSPLKDEYSHGAEAWCYAAVVADEMVNEEMAIKDPYAGFNTYAA